MDDYKLHAVCEMQGMIHSYDMVAASIYNFHYFKDVQWEFHGCMMFRNKEYLSVHMQ